MKPTFPITRCALRHFAAAALLCGVSGVLAAQVGRPGPPPPPAPRMYVPRPGGMQPPRFGGQQGGAVMGPQMNGARPR
ncbi:MAG: hypothetical protein V4734_12375, partial [Terriglobus sp.]